MAIVQIIGWAALILILVIGAVIKHKTKGFLQDIDGARGIVTVDTTKRSKVIANIE